MHMSCFEWSQLRWSLLCPGRLLLLWRLKSVVKRTNDHDCVIVEINKIY